MSIVDGLRHRWHALAHRREHELNVAAEIAFHVERDAAQLQHDSAELLGEPHAVQAARRRNGNLTNCLEDSRRATGWSALDTCTRNVHAALRLFRTAPLFTTLIVGTLALGIGGATAMFSAAYALLLRPLPFFEAQQLMSVSLTVPAFRENRAQDGVPWSYPKFMEFKRAQHLYSDLTLWASTQFTLRSGTDTRRIGGEYTDSHYFSTLGIPLALGRNFTESEDSVGRASAVAILSHGLWRDMFGADSSAIGRVVQVDGYSYRIVGVAAPNFRGVPGTTVLWMPLTSAPDSWNSLGANNHQYFALARLASGVAVEAAQKEMPQLGARVDAAFPDRSLPSLHWSAVARELNAARTHPRGKQTLFILLGAVAFVLLATSGNVASLLVLRSSARHRDTAVRLALGATRTRLLQQMGAESFVLAVGGGVASLGVAFVVIQILQRMQADALVGVNYASRMGTVYFSAVRFDSWTVVIACALTLAVGVLFSIAPAIQCARAPISGPLADGEPGANNPMKRGRVRQWLTVVQIAFAVVLLAGAGLMYRSLQHLLKVPTGIDALSMLALRVNRAPEWSRDSIDKFYDLALRKLAALPGVTGVAMNDCPPLDGCNGQQVIRQDRPAAGRGEAPRAGVHWITPGWPELMHVPLLRGRLFTRADDFTSRRGVLINETAARRIWPGENPIGRQIKLGDDKNDAESATVIGVVGDVLYNPVNARPEPDVYLSYYQTHMTYRMMLFVRTSGAPDKAAPAVISALHGFAPGFPVYDVRNVTQRVADSTAYASIVTGILVTFAAFALILAMIGTYGVVAFSVTQREREISLRVALGATRTSISRLVARQIVVMSVLGMLAGLTIAVGTTKALQSLLFEVTPTDPLTLASIAGVLLVAVVLATWIPARRALKCVPASVLRVQ